MIVLRSAPGSTPLAALLTIRQLFRPRVLMVMWVAILGAASTGSANEAQYYLCKAARALGSASARAHIFGEVFGTDIPAEQFLAIADHMTAASIYISQAEALFGEPFATERMNRGTGARVLAMIENYLATYGTMSARQREERINQIFSVYDQGLHVTFVSSRPDAFQWNANCDTQVLRTCFNFGKAIIAAASAGTAARPRFVDGYQGQANEQMLQAIQSGLAIAMDTGARPPDGHANKICCGFGSPAEWAEKPAFARTSASGLYVGFEPIMLRIIADAVPAPNSPCWSDSSGWCSSTHSGTPWTSRMTLTDLRVYENDGSAGPRTYGTRFDQATTRYIGWEAHFAHTSPGRRIDFSIDYVIYSSDGHFAQGTLDTYLESDWTTSFHRVVWGWPQLGNWPVGYYRIDLFITGKKIGDTSFEIYAGQPPPPPPPVNPPPVNPPPVNPPPVNPPPVNPPFDCPVSAPSPNWDLETGPGAITQWYWDAGLSLYCGYLRSGGALNQYRLQPSGNGYFLGLWRLDTGVIDWTMRLDRDPPPDPSTGWVEAGPLFALQVDGTWKEISWWFGRVP